MKYQGHDGMGVRLHDGGSREMALGQKEVVNNGKKMQLFLIKIKTKKIHLFHSHKFVYEKDGQYKKTHAYHISKNK